MLYLADRQALPEGPQVTAEQASPALPRGRGGGRQPGGAPNASSSGRTQTWNWRRGPAGHPTSSSTRAWKTGPGRAVRVRMHLARLLSVVLSTATVAAAYAPGAPGLAGAPLLALAAAGVLAFLPEFLFIGAAVNNDNAAALFGTLALLGAFLIWRAGGRLRPGWWTPLALGCGLLAKVSTAALWPAVAAAIVAGAAEGDRLAAPPLGRIWASRGRWLATGLLVFLPALLIASPWLLRNWALYGDPTGMALARQTIDLRTAPWTWADTLWLLRGWFVSFWGKFGGAGHMPMAGVGLCLAGGGDGRCRAGPGARVCLAARWRWARTSAALLLLAAGSVAVAMWQYSLTALGTDQGRLLYPAVAPLVLLWVLGLWAGCPCGGGGRLRSAWCWRARRWACMGCGA